MTKEILKKDLPEALYWTWYYWVENGASREEIQLQEKEQVKAFLQWCTTQEAWEDFEEQERKWLTENGYSPTPSGNQTT